jgi:hypothetical protein
VRSFGARAIDLDGFEVYSREDAAESAFDYALYEKCKPFPEHPRKLRSTNFGHLESVFSLSAMMCQPGNLMVSLLSLTL